MRQITWMLGLTLTLVLPAAAEPSGDAAFANTLNNGAKPLFKDFGEMRDRIAKEGASAVAWLKKHAPEAKQVTRESTWAEIAKASGVKAKFPGFMVGAQWTPVTGFCLKDGQVHAAYTERVCDGQIVEGRDGDTRCQGRSFQEAWVYVTKLIPVEGVPVRVCKGTLVRGADGTVRCETGRGFQEGWSTVLSPIPLSYQVDVVSTSEGRDGDQRENRLFEKEYNIGSCQ